MKLSVVELFAGVGGFRVGLNKIKDFDSVTGLAKENGNWDIVWANQWEPSTSSQAAYECYIRRFGDKNTSNTDINKINKEDIPNHTLLVGGFPCQDYSVARSRTNEMGIKGKKGVLWWDIAEILFKKKPPFVLLENVDRLLKSPSNQRGRDFAVMLKTFEEYGYIVQWRMINAAEYGMPQRRKRVFIFASHSSTNYSNKLQQQKYIDKYMINNSIFSTIFPIDIINEKTEIKKLSNYKDNVDITNKYKDNKFLNFGFYIDGKAYNYDFKEQKNSKTFTLGEIVDKARFHNYNYDDYIIDNKALEKWKYLKGNKKILRTKPNGDNYYYTEGQMAFPDSLNNPARTMLTSESTINRSSHIIFDEKINAYRKITEIEAELIQMFPPNWTNTGMTTRQRYFMMGNALVTGIVKRIGEELEEIVLNEKDL